MPEPLSQQHPRPTPVAKSKTDLRRGQFTPGISNGKKPASAPPRRNTGTTRAEEAMLLDELLGE